MIAEWFGNGTIGWSFAVLSQNHVLLSISLVGVFLHGLLWAQFVYHKSSFDLTFIFPIGYISTDVFVISGYLVQYGIRSRAMTTTSRGSCYFEAYFALYFNILESFYLTSLNVCRYWQIVRNQRVYSVHRRLILTVYGVIPILILINMIVQHQFGWCLVIEAPGSSCSVVYNSLAVRIWNVGIIFALPAIISFVTSARCFTFVRNKNSEQTILRRNHHRQLLCRFSTFYTIWFTLWSPFVLLTFLSIKTISNQTSFIVAIGSTLETSIDGVLISALDKRFEMSWKKTFDLILERFGWKRRVQVHPIFHTTVVTQKPVPPVIKND